MNNIYFNHLKFKFQDLQESKFLDSIFELLKKQMGDQFYDFVFYIHSSNFLDRSPLPIILDKSKKNVLLYLSDEHSTIPSYLLDYFHVVFKCYLPVENINNKALIAFPLGYVKETIQMPIVPIYERTLNVFFSGTLNENRILLYQHLTSFSNLTNKFNFRTIFTNKMIYSLGRRNLSKVFPDSYIVFTEGFKSGLSPNDYSNLLHNSKIAICPKGFHSAETFRHYEALRAGCIVISEKLPDNYLYKDSPIIQLENWSNLKSVINVLIKDKDQLEELHHKSLNWYKNVFSEKAVSDLMYNTLSGI